MNAAALKCKIPCGNLTVTSSPFPCTALLRLQISDCCIGKKTKCLLPNLELTLLNHISSFKTTPQEINLFYKTDFKSIFLIKDLFFLTGTIKYFYLQLVRHNKFDSLCLRYTYHIYKNSVNLRNI